MGNCEEECVHQQESLPVRVPVVLQRDVEINVEFTGGFARAATKIRYWPADYISALDNLFNAKGRVHCRVCHYRPTNDVTTSATELNLRISARISIYILWIDFRKSQHNSIINSIHRCASLMA